MQEVQPKGPYYLGGWSLGGSIAFEMARQLKAMGEETAWLGMIDSPAPYKLNLPSMNELISWFARDLTGLDFKTPQNAMGDFEKQILAVLEFSQAEGALSNDVTSDQLMRIFKVFKANIEIQQSYSHKNLSKSTFNTHLFRATENSINELCKHYPAISNNDFGWKKLLDNIQVKDVHGSHYSVMEVPGIALLAEMITDSLMSSENEIEYLYKDNKEPVLE